VTDELRQVLVVDDDDSLRKALKETIEAAGYGVLLAPDAKTASELLVAERTDMVLSDIRMPGMDGVKFLQVVKKLKPVPVILMTGFSDLCETQRAYDLGASGFLAKPFKKEELLALLVTCLGPSASAPRKISAEPLVRVNIEDFATGRMIHGDVFVKMVEGEFVKVAHRGADLTDEQIRSFRAKDIRHLYTIRDELARHLAIDSGLAAPLDRATRVKRAALIKLAEDSFRATRGKLAELPSELVDYAESYVPTAVSLLTFEAGMVQLLSGAISDWDRFLPHATGTCAITMMLAREMRWTTLATLFRAAMASFVHDIGKRGLDRAVLSLAPEERTPAQAKLIETHPVRGAQFLRDFHSLPVEIAQIVLQHHESCAGTGFPKGIKRNHIHPLARLIAVADTFWNAISQGQAASDIAWEMTSGTTGDLDPTFVASLARIVETNSKRNAA
jgi:response regulator RpfG family c-di-GMP phosphodiesterase